MWGFCTFVQYTTVKVKLKAKHPINHYVSENKQTNKQTNKKADLNDAVIKKNKIYTSVNEIPQFPLQ